MNDARTKIKRSDMMKQCSVPGCQSGTYEDRVRRKNNGLPKIGMFSVPQNNKLRKEWEYNLGIHLKKTHFVCECHFDDMAITVPDWRKIVDRGQESSLALNVVPLRNYNVKFVNHDAKSCCIKKSAYGIPPKVDKGSEVPSNLSLNDASKASPKFNALESSPKLNVDEAPETLPNRNEENVLKALENCKVEDNAARKENFTIEPFSKLLDEMALPQENFTIEPFNKLLDEMVLPQLWSWSKMGSAIVLTNLRPDDYSVKVQLIIAPDLTVQIRTGTGHVVNDGYRIQSKAELKTCLRILERCSICSGTGIDSNKRDSQCSGVLRSDGEYTRTWKNNRCKRCKILRNKIKNKSSENEASVYVTAKNCRKICKAQTYIFTLKGISNKQPNANVNHDSF